MKTLTMALALIALPQMAFAQDGDDELAPRPPKTVKGKYYATPAPAPVAAPAPAIVRTVPVERPGSFGAFYPTATTDAAIAQWRALRNGGSFPFATYASFISANPGFPGEKGLRDMAERAMGAAESPALVIAFYRNAEPRSGRGWARLASARAALGQASALDAARRAWSSGDLSNEDEALLMARFSGQLTSADHDARADALLFNKRPGDAARFLSSVSPARRAAFSARIALQNRASDAESQWAAVAGIARTDAGLLMDRARYLRDTNRESEARSLFAQPRALTSKPVDVERFTDMMVILSRGAAADRQWTSAYNIARQLGDLYSGAGSDQPYAVRDNVTTLAWLAGTTALNQLGRPRDAAAAFETYAGGGQSLQVLTKGRYWAGQALARAGDVAGAQAHYSQAAAVPELFYGQMALERLGRPVTAPLAWPSLVVTQADYDAFQRKPLVAAVRQSAGNRSDQSLFVRALAADLKTDKERLMAAQLGNMIGRPDLAVWTEREARNSGSRFNYRLAYPTHSFASAQGSVWPLVHGITRQESSFDRAVVSHANAWGMMQLLPSTAREQAGKMGIGYDGSRLTDPSYNVMLGSGYFQRLLDRWGGSAPLAIASYNAGAGNVSKWIAAYGDPRTGAIDMVSWMEKIPFEETRGYVQRVLEGSVVYSTMAPADRMTRPVTLSMLLRTPVVG